MNPSVFIDNLNWENPSEFKDIKHLDRLLKNHPYFQLGLAAKTRLLKTRQHIDYLKTSRKTAVIFPDRAKLHQFLNQPVLAKIKPENNIQTENVPEVIDSDTQIIDQTKNTVPQEPIPDKKTKIIPDAPTSTELEKEYLVEAINQSIQLEASGYSVEDALRNDSLKNEENQKKSNDEILSFSEWLTGEKNTASDQVHIKLIDRFITESPVISPVQKKDFYSPVEKGRVSISDENLPISETLAEIFALQGNKEMAIKGYQKLMLKYPEKSIYFAGLIKKIKES